MKKWLSPLLELFYPSTCLACGQATDREKQEFCAACILNIAYTDFNDPQNNELTRRLIAIPNLKYGIAPYYFSKNSPLKDLLYKFKYQGRRDLAERAGRSLANYVTGKLNMAEIDAVTFVPLHPKKFAARGYNQSEILAAEIAESSELPLLKCLERTKLTETQTHFGRGERLENQQNSLKCSNNVLKVNHLLLVDDVLTTGATIETCTDAVYAIHKDITVSICTLAIADAW